jgi:hypothetical protein
MTPALAALAFLVPPVAPDPAPSPLPADAHWSLVPPARPTVPSAAAHPIDAFVRAKLAAAGIPPAPPADKLALVRRAFLDVTGLPPTPAEIDRFVNDPSPDAWEKLIDRLLASPHFGERWAQHWLDVVRFAETNGYELDADRPDAWRYRDYVVRSLNADKPYTQFIREQVAGDELAAGKDAKAAADLLVATGMHRCGPVHVVGGNLDQAQLRQERLTEMVNGLGAAVLGMTVACARCHDHKFDPLSQADYYRLQAFFAAAEYKDHPLASKAERQAYDEAAEKAAAGIHPRNREVQAIEAPYRKKLKEAKVAALDGPTRAAFAVEAAKRTPEQKKLVQSAQPLVNVSWDEVLAALSPEDRAKRQKLRDEVRAIEEARPPPPAKAWGLVRAETVPPTRVLRRGDPNRPKDEILRPGFPRALTRTAARPTTRTELADWLCDPRHPLTARVAVNRVWHHYFGRGIVGTVNDFGTRGDHPSHPELLDWLAVEFAEGGWTPKRLHRLILTSETYRQAARVPAPPAAAAADPDNRLLWRMNRKRLDGEAIRDAMLAAAGTLNRQVGGPSVRVPLEPEVYDLIFTEAEPDGLWPVTADPKQHGRRSLYLFAKRNVRLPMLEAFDQPDTLTPCNGRGVSTYAPQALILMNGPFAREQGRALAASLPAADPLPELYRRAVGRPPTDAERAAAGRFLEGPDRATALADLCLAVFNTNEFVYVP